MNKILSYITALNYADRILLILSGASSDVSLFSFMIVTGRSGEIAAASISLVFLVTNGIIKFFLKTMKRKKVKTSKLLYWPEEN